VRYWTKSKAGVVTAFRELFRTKEKAEEYAGKIKKHSEKTPVVEYQKSSARYNIYYELNPYLKNQIENEIPDVQLSACRVHNVRLKFPITVSGSIALGKKDTGYILSWEPRGGTRHKFCIKGTAGRPDITIDVHPNSLVAYPDAGQTVYAASIEESKALIISTIEKAVNTFIEQQKEFGTEIEIQNLSLAGKVGKLITKPHFGFKHRTGGITQGQTIIQDCWDDDSPTKNGEKGYSEFETENEVAATALDSAVLDVCEGRKILGKNAFIANHEQLETVLKYQKTIDNKVTRLWKVVTEIQQELFNRKDGVIS